MYPEISKFVALLHGKGISSFLVTNAQFPEAIRLNPLILFWQPYKFNLTLIVKSAFLDNKSL